MLFRPASKNDLGSICAIIAEAKIHLRDLGIDQWQSDYPDQSTMLEDIVRGDAYVLESGDRVAGTVTVSFAGEPSYRHLKGGTWETGDNYGVIHRMAIADHFRGGGLSVKLLAEVEKLCAEKGMEAIKADTHPDNNAMRRLMEKNGFAPRGLIFYQGGDKIAYEKVLPTHSEKVPERV